MILWNRIRPRFAGAGAALVIGLLGLGPAPAAIAQPAAPMVDISGWQGLLNDYLTVISAKGEPLDTRFDYEKLYDAKGRFERMARIQRELLAVPPSQMDSTSRLAWAINVYNFTVIQLATEHLLVPQHGRQRYKSVRDIPIPNGGFFKAPVLTIEGTRYSLDEFERAFCFAGWPRDGQGAPPAALDPRVHFAIVCGANGCPPLMPRAYRPDSLGRQLDAASRASMALPRHLRWNEKIKRLEMSSVFHWYTGDFGGRDGTLRFARGFAPARLRATIDAHKLTSLGGLIPWDWDLNQTDRKKTL